nr:beta-ketoacyl synthase N-terminal-like domain-containing protein [Shewanella cyperi]
MSRTPDQPIAIVGMAARFPGCKDIDAFWRLIDQGLDAHSPIDAAKFGAPVADYLGRQGEGDRFYCQSGGYIRDFSFDPEGYVPGKEAMSKLASEVDEHILWALDTAKAALKDAGLKVDAADKLGRCGLVMGTLSFPSQRSNRAMLPLYHNEVQRALTERLPGFPALAASAPQRANDTNTAALPDAWTTDIAAEASKLLAQCLGLGAAHLSLDAACASSVYALKLACDYLATGKADTMLAAAVSGADPFFISMGFSIFHAYPEQGFSAPLDKQSGGLFAGEGAGVLVLKRLSDALRDGDTIHGVIHGAGLSNDGRGQFVLSPSSSGQVRAFERAYEAAGKDPAAVEVIECHATGTPLGDKVELSSMEQFFGPRLKGSKPPLIGSVKSNLTHLLTAAGMPGIIKLLLAMKQRRLPPSVRLSQPIASPDKLFGEHNIVRQPLPWPTKEGNTAPLAGLSVFGFGGCNAHLVLGAWDDAVSSEKSQAVLANSQTEKPHNDFKGFHIQGAAIHVGKVDSLASQYRLQQTGATALSPLPEQRWKGLEHNRALLEHFGLSGAPEGGYIDSFALDFLRFRLPPHPGDRLVAQQLLLMKVADEAIRDADLKPGARVAVLVAMETELELHQFRGRVNLHSQVKDSLLRAGISLSAEEYQALERLAMDSVLPAASLNQYTSYIGNIMASRVASLWDFNGPAFTISAGELSVARALEVAENLCATQELDAVVLAAVDLAGSAEKVLHHAALLEQANLAPADGAGALVLLPTPTSASASTSLSKEQGRYGELQPIAFDNAPVNGNEALADNALVEFSPQLKAVTKGKERADHSLQQDSASAQLGHSFVAAAMASLTRALLRLTDSEQDTARVQFGDKASVLLTQTQAQKDSLKAALVNADKQQVTEGKQLIQQITLGGKAIAGHIRGAELPFEAEIKAKLLAATAFQKNLQTAVPVAQITQASHAAHRNTAANQPIDSGVPASVKYQPHSFEAKSMQTAGLATAPAAMPVPLTPGSHAEAIAANQALALQAHQAFLQSREAGLKLADALMQKEIGRQDIGQNEIERQGLMGHAPLATEIPKPGIKAPELKVPTPTPAAPAPATPAVAPQAATKPCIWNYQDLVQYAEGDIAPVFGPDYAIIDSYRRRVRLPTTDYLLVSRVTKLNARLGEFKPSSMTTEYDIPVDAPYLVDGQIPWAVAVESGQCDLMLISFLGIDLENKGERVYRLLDCTLTFLDDLPRGGDTLRYDISINNFARNGDTLLFFFSYECFVGDRLILKMDGGCAGFFTDAELADGKGVIRTEDELKARRFAEANKRSFAPLLHCPESRFDYQRLSHLLSGDVAACFGPSHDLGYQQPSLCFASEKFLMIEEVSKVDTRGGAWGLGLIEGHKRLEPDHWYFPCHFKDDPVMAGSLMAEGCGQLLQFYMLYLGLHKHTQNGRFQPLAQAPQKVRCRGQVLPQSNRLTYRMEVTDIGLTPSPWAKANIEIILDGKVVVDFQNLGVELKEDNDCTRYSGNDSHQAPVSGASPALLEGRQASVNAPLMTHEADLNASPIKGVVPVKHIPAPPTPDCAKGYTNRTPDTLPFTPWHMFEFATGNIENCFGPEFAVYRGLIPPRTPCGDLQLTTRVVDVKGKRGDFKAPASCIGEYEVPPRAWYFSENSHPARMPYSILMEIALQPNGFISGYMGTTLGFPGLELFFRNLDGEGKLIKNIDLRGKTISNDSRLLSTVMSGTNIIQTFSFALAADGEPFYEGKAVFGYFKAEALTHQLGLDNGRTTTPWYQAENAAPDVSYDLRDTGCALYRAAPGKAHLRLPGGRLNFVDTVKLVRRGGKAGLGYAYGERAIDPSDWFFRFHFHQDPVMPGSLGVEAIIELLSSFALDAGLGEGFANPRFNHCLSTVKWKYRGQISPLNKQMSLELHVTAIEREPGRVTLKADAWLAKDGLRIYEITDLALAIEEA